MDKKVYSGLDVGKLIAALLVVVLHAVETTAWVPAGVKYVATRFAVPFFFLTSGFFFWKGLSRAADAKRYFINYEKHLLKVLAVWELIIYLPFTIKTYLEKYAGVSVLRFIALLARRILIIGSGPYWYLIALFWSAAFIYLCFRSKKEEVLIWCGIVIGAVLEICYACFRGVLSSIPIFRLLFRAIYGIWSWEFNFLMFGIPFMGAGWLMAKHKAEWPVRKALLVFLLSTALRLLEYNLPLFFPHAFWEENSISFAFIPQAVSFFLLMKSWQPRIGKERSLALRQLSSTIYYTHAIFLYELLNPLMDRFTDLPTYDGKMIPVKVIVTVSLCCAFFWVIKKIRNPHLNILING